MRLTEIASIVLATLLPALSVSAEPEIKGSPAELSNYLQNIPKTVTLTAEAEAKGQADRAVISLRVITENRQLTEALRANAEIRSQIASDLNRRGIEADRIKSARFSSTQKHSIFKEKARSHRVEHTVQVTVKDEKEFQATANLADSISEVHYVGVEPELSDKEALRRKAISLAIANAAEKKTLFEKALDVKLTPRGFSESVAPKKSDELRHGYGMPYQTSIPMSPPGGPVQQLVEEQQVASDFGEFIYVARVNVDYAVAPK